MRVRERGDCYALDTERGRRMIAVLTGVGADDVYIGRFFECPAHECVREDTPRLSLGDDVAIARFGDLNGRRGAWTLMGCKAPLDDTWLVEDFGVGREQGPWWRVHFAGGDPSAGNQTRFPIDYETFDALPSGDVLESASSLERLLDRVCDDRRRFHRLALVRCEAEAAGNASWFDTHAAISPPVRFYLYFPERDRADAAARRIGGALALDVSVRRSPKRDWVLVADGKQYADQAFERTRSALEAIAEEFDGEYDGHERAVSRT